MADMTEEELQEIERAVRTMNRDGSAPYQYYFYPREFDHRDLNGDMLELVAEVRRLREVEAELMAAEAENAELRKLVADQLVREAEEMGLYAAEEEE